MKLLICTRYIFNQLFFSSLAITFSLTLAVWLTQSFRFIDIVLNNGFPFSTFFYLVIFLIPNLIGVILPVSFFIGCLFVCYNLLDRSEIIVMQSSGFSQGQILQAPIILSIILSLFFYSLNMYLIPFSFRKFKNIEHQIRLESSVFFLKPGYFNVIQNITIYVQNILSDGSFKGILIYDQRCEKTPVILSAKVGLLDINDNGSLMLFSGTYQQQDLNDNIIKVIDFDEYKLKIPYTNINYVRQNHKIYEEYIDKLLFPNVSDKKKKLKLQVEGFKRILSPILFFCFSIIAFVFLLGRYVTRSKYINRLFFCIIFVIFLQVIFLSLINSAEKTLWPILYALFILLLSIFFSFNFFTIKNFCSKSIR